MATTTRLICAAAPHTPFIADADTGGGNALNVQRTIKDLIAAGAAGCFLEDQEWPKKCGHLPGKKVIPADEHAAKIAAAREVIGDSDFFLVARTDARATDGLAEAISRANLYLEAGADAIFVAGPRSDEDLKEIGSKINGLKACTMLEGGITPLHTPEELKEMGFHLVVYPFTSIYASARGMIDTLKTLKESGTTRDHLNKVTTFDEFNQLLDVKSCLEFEKRYSSFKKDV